MNELFVTTLNMSISASWLILVILILRIFLKKAPKWIHVLLWGIVAIRLLCPFSIESSLSLIPSAETIPIDIEMDTTPAIDSGVYAINNVVNPIISNSNTPAVGDSVNPLQITIAIGANIWILGVIALLAYSFISYWSLHRKVRTAFRIQGNIYQSETVNTPFVLGIIRPRIYLPFKLDEPEIEHIISHEQTHIQHKDHLWKPLGFLLLTLHWFNPLMWLAYILLCRDIELSCDEHVIKNLCNEQRADYTQALLTCSINRHMIAACPLAFGEVSVKERVKSVMNYKKSTFWIIAASIILLLIVAICFLTNPKQYSIDAPYPGIVSFKAKILEIHDDYLLVEPLYNSIEKNSANRMEMPTNRMDPELEPQIGDIIKINHSGEILETYPAKLTDVYFIEASADTHKNIDSLTETQQSDPLDEAISAAIWEYYDCDIADNEFFVESHVILANEEMLGTTNHIEEVTVYLYVSYEIYYAHNGILYDTSGGQCPIAITFFINESGEYIVKEYWEPRDGIYYCDDICAKFPGEAAANALNSQTYYEDLQTECHEKAFAYIDNL